MKRTSFLAIFQSIVIACSFYAKPAFAIGYCGNDAFYQQELRRKTISAPGPESLPETMPTPETKARISPLTKQDLEQIVRQGKSFEAYGLTLTIPAQDLKKITNPGTEGFQVERAAFGFSKASGLREAFSVESDFVLGTTFLSISKEDPTKLSLKTKRLILSASRPTDLNSKHEVFLDNFEILLDPNGFIYEARADAFHALDDGPGVTKHSFVISKPKIHFGKLDLFWFSDFFEVSLEGIEWITRRFDDQKLSEMISEDIWSLKPMKWKRTRDYLLLPRVADGKNHSAVGWRSELSIEGASGRISNFKLGQKDVEYFVMQPFTMQSVGASGAPLYAKGIENMRKELLSIKAAPSPFFGESPTKVIFEALGSFFKTPTKTISYHFGGLSYDAAKYDGLLSGGLTQGHEDRFTIGEIKGNSYLRPLNGDSFQNTSDFYLEKLEKKDRNHHLLLEGLSRDVEGKSKMTDTQLAAKTIARRARAFGAPVSTLRFFNPIYLGTSMLWVDFDDQGSCTFKIDHLFVKDLNGISESKEIALKSKSGAEGLDFEYSQGMFLNAPIQVPSPRYDQACDQKTDCGVSGPESALSALSKPAKTETKPNTLSETRFESIVATTHLKLDWLRFAKLLRKNGTFGVIPIGPALEEMKTGSLSAEFSAFFNRSGSENSDHLHLDFAFDFAGFANAAAPKTAHDPRDNWSFNNLQREYFAKLIHDQAIVGATTLKGKIQINGWADTFIKKFLDLPVSVQTDPTIDWKSYGIDREKQTIDLAFEKTQSGKILVNEKADGRLNAAWQIWQMELKNRLKDLREELKGF